MTCQNEISENWAERKNQWGYQIETVQNCHLIPYPNSSESCRTSAWLLIYIRFDLKTFIVKFSTPMNIKKDEIDFANDLQKASHITGRVIVLIPLECVNRSKLKWKMTLIGIQRYEISY